MIQFLTFAMVGCLFADLAVRRGAEVFVWGKDKISNLVK